MIPDMTIVSVLYPRHGESRFDHEYYLQKHMPLLQQRWAGMGLVKMEWMRGVAAPDGGEPGYEVITLLSFASKEAFEAALAASGEEIIGDISNFTNVNPLIQINEPVSPLLFGKL
jgi:uncharacterized protein (TIGR02118 family)